MAGHWCAEGTRELWSCCARGLCSWVCPPTGFRQYLSHLVCSSRNKNSHLPPKALRWYQKHHVLQSKQRSPGCAQPCSCSGHLPQQSCQLGRGRGRKISIALGKRWVLDPGVEGKRREEGRPHPQHHHPMLPKDHLDLAREQSRLSKDQVVLPAADLSPTPPKTGRRALGKCQSPPIE